MSDNGKKTAGKTAVVPQKHGGALLTGGVPGNKGGTGRPPNELRGSMREILEKGLPHLEEFATGENDAKPAYQLKAIDIAARYDATEAILPDDPAITERLQESMGTDTHSQTDGGRMRGALMSSNSTAHARVAFIGSLFPCGGQVYAFCAPSRQVGDDGGTYGFMLCTPIRRGSLGRVI